MGDFNSNSPTLLGLEWRPQSSRLVTVSNTQAVMCRFRGSAVTPANLHAYLTSLLGAQVCWEILSTPIPAFDPLQTIRPGTATGLNVNGWVDFATGVPTFGHLSDNSTATGANMTGAFLDGSWSYPMEFRGVTALSPASHRIVYAQLHATAKYTGVGSHALGGAVGTVFGVGPGAGVVNVSSGGVWNTYDYPVAYLDIGSVNAGSNWTNANLNGIVNGTDVFGVMSQGLTGGGSLSVGDMWVTVQLAAENRLMASYNAATSAVGWKPYAWSGAEGTGAAVALAANTWYYLVLWCRSGTAQIPLLQDVNVVMAATAASATGEHRQASVVPIGNSGLISSTPTPNAGEIPAFLMEAPAAAIHSQSQPYAVVAPQVVGTGASVSQQITAPGISSYSSVKFGVAWESPSTRPDQPMTIEIRHGGGASTGGGTLDAIATLGVNDVVNGASMQDVNVPFSVAFNSAAATQYFVYFRSAATSGKRWTVQQLDAKDDVLTTTTTAQVEGAGIGGTTDAFVNNAGTGVTRYDLSTLMLGAGVPPAGVTVVAKVAA